MRRKLPRAILLFFAFVGMIIIANAVHEFSHRADLHEIALNEEICLLNIPLGGESAAAYYRFTLNKSEIDQYNKIEEYTEWKAYALMSPIILIFLVCFFAMLCDT